MRSLILMASSGLLAAVLGGVGTKSDTQGKYESKQAQPVYDYADDSTATSKLAAPKYEYQTLEDRVSSLESDVSALNAEVAKLRSKPEATPVADVKSTTTVVAPQEEFAQRIEAYKAEIAKIEETQRKAYEQRLTALSADLKKYSPTEIVKAIEKAGYKATYFESGGSSGTQAQSVNYSAPLSTYATSSYATSSYAAPSYYAPAQSSTVTYRTGLFGRTYKSAVSNSPQCRIVNGNVVCD